MLKYFYITSRFENALNTMELRHLLAISFCPWVGNLLHKLKAYGTFRPLGTKAFNLRSLLFILAKCTLYTVDRVCGATLTGLPSAGYFRTDKLEI